MEHPALVAGPRRRLDCSDGGNLLLRCWKHQPLPWLTEEANQREASRRHTISLVVLAVPAECLQIPISPPKSIRNAESKLVAKNAGQDESSAVKVADLLQVSAIPVDNVRSVVEAAAIRLMLEVRPQRRRNGLQRQMPQRS